MAVAAVGQIENYPEDSLQAAQAAAGIPVTGGLFVPPFSSRGPELDLCAPGVTILACQPPDGYAICDGTSLAAAHVAALAALIFAHHDDFRGSFAQRDFQRVERLFQILKDTAQPIGHLWQTGAGLPDAARALGIASLRRPLAAPLNAEPRGPANISHLPLNPRPLTSSAGSFAEAGVHELKAAMMLAGLSDSH
jgi:subtilisin family serine protease